MRLAIKLAALSLLLLASCSKPGEEEESEQGVLPTKTRKELLTQGKWMIASVKAVHNVQGEVDSTDEGADLDSCEMDDFVKFGNDGLVTNFQGNILCDPTDPQQEVVSKWQFAEGESKLLLGQDNSEMEVYTILELSPAVMRLFFKEEDSANQIFTSREMIFKNVL